MAHRSNKKNNSELIRKLIEKLYAVSELKNQEKHSRITYDLKQDWHEQGKADMAELLS